MSTDTPMMRQYLEVKAANPDALLLMRMGDFYEAFLDDAKALARVAGVALTSRNKDDPDPLPMAGIPHHQLQAYLPRLLAGGLKVAIMDQLEDPAQAKGLVKRGLTRLITPGTLVDEDTLPAGAANHLVARVLRQRLNPLDKPTLVALLRQAGVDQHVATYSAALRDQVHGRAMLTLPDLLRVGGIVSGLSSVDACRFLLDGFGLTSGEGADLWAAVCRDRKAASK